MDIEEGAVNEEVAVSPTDDEQVNVEDTDSEVVGQDQEEGETENAPEEAETGAENERSIPKPRFDAVNERMKAAETRAAELERQNQEFQSRQADLTKAHAAGYPDIDSYRYATTQAQQAGFPDVEAQNEYFAYANTQNERLNNGAIDPETHQELLNMRFERVQTQAALKETKALLGQQMLSTRDAEIRRTKEAIAEYGAELDPELEALLKDSSPAVIEKFRTGMLNTVKKSAQATGSKYLAAKEADAAKVPPTSRRPSGRAPSPQSPPQDMSWKSQSMGQIFRDTFLPKA